MNACKVLLFISDTFQSPQEIPKEAPESKQSEMGAGYPNFLHLCGIQTSRKEKKPTHSTPTFHVKQKPVPTHYFSTRPTSILFR